MTTDLDVIPSENGRELATTNRRGVAADAALTREAQEVQAAILVAQRCPRDEIEAERRILQACKRKGLAEQAMYAYPRGGTTVTGPSIRLAEVLAQNWGNMSCGIKELAQRKGESEMVAFAWDLETNFRVEKVFTVKHERHTKNGVTKLTDPRDIYEIGANQGSRRLRACILGVIPGDIIEAAIGECEKTLAGNNTEPIADRVKKMLARFEEIGVSKSQIEKRLGHKIDAILPVELVQLGKMYKSVVDGAAKVEDFFATDGGASPKQTGQAAEMDAALNATPTPAPESKPIQQPDASGGPSDDADMLANDLASEIDQATTKSGLESIGSAMKKALPLIGEARHKALLTKWQAKFATLKK